MQGYAPLSIGRRLVALGAAALASTLVMLAAILPFGLDSPQRGQAIVAREAAVHAMRAGAREPSASEPAGQRREARSELGEAFP